MSNRFRKMRVGGRYRRMKYVESENKYKNGNWFLRNLFSSPSKTTDAGKKRIWKNEEGIQYESFAPPRDQL